MVWKLGRVDQEDVASTLRCIDLYVWYDRSKVIATYTTLENNLTKTEVEVGRDGVLDGVGM